MEDWKLCESRAEEPLVRILTSFAFSILFLFVFPIGTRADVVVHDAVVREGETVLLGAETRGKFFARGGEVVEFLIDGRSLGSTLSGGDGFAFKQFIPQRTGIHRVTAKSGKDEGRGLLLSLRKGAKIVFVDVAGSLLEKPFSKKPRQGSEKAIKEINGKFPVVFLHAGMVGIKALRGWLKENGFIERPLLPWNEGRIFDELNEKGFAVKAVIGGPGVIESAKKYGPLAFSFEETEDAAEVKDWGEIKKRLR